MACAMKRGGRGVVAGCSIIFTTFCANASAAPTGTNDSGGRISGTPPAAVATTGRLSASAFKMTLPSPSRREQHEDVAAATARQRDHRAYQVHAIVQPRGAISSASDFARLPPHRSPTRQSRRERGPRRGIRCRGPSRPSAPRHSPRPARTRGSGARCGYRGAEWRPAALLRRRCHRGPRSRHRWQCRRRPGRA